MELGSSNHFHQHHRKSFFDPSDCTPRLCGKLFRNPLTYVLLVWGLMFVILAVSIAYAQDAGQAGIHQRTAHAPCVATDPSASDRKIEIVEIFDTGEAQVVPPEETKVKTIERRRAAAARSRVER